MEYLNNTDYSKKIREAIAENNRNVARAEEELKRLQSLGLEMRRSQEYEAEQIMPIFCQIVSEIENREFTWGTEHFFYPNPRHPAYADIVDLIYLMAQGTEFDMYSFEGKMRKELSPNGAEEYWDSSPDFLKVVYRNMEVGKGSYLSGRYPSFNGNIDFSRNNLVAKHEWGVDGNPIYMPYFSRLSNPNFSYLLDFIRYCSYWRIMTDYSTHDLYSHIQGLVPSFVEEYKRTRKP